MVRKIDRHELYKMLQNIDVQNIEDVFEFYDEIRKDDDSHISDILKDFKEDILRSVREEKWKAIVGMGAIVSGVQVLFKVFHF